MYPKVVDLGNGFSVIFEGKYRDISHLKLYEGDSYTLKDLEEQDAYYRSLEISDLIAIIEDGVYDDEMYSIIRVLRDKDFDVCMEMCRYILDNKIGDEYLQGSVVDQMRMYNYDKPEESAILEYTNKFLDENVEVKALYESYNSL